MHLPPVQKDGSVTQEEREHEQLRQASVWARIFIRETGRELTGRKNDYFTAASQLMVLMAELNGLTKG